MKFVLSTWNIFASTIFNNFSPIYNKSLIKQNCQVEIIDTMGRLYCVDGLVSTSCWLKIITLAKDCHSCNVILMTHDRGVILKTTRSIKPGEPLQMWFSDHILAMLNIKPFLAPINIQGKIRTEI